MRNNGFHQTQPGHVEKTSVLGNWTDFEVDRTKIGMYMAIQIENLVLVPLTAGALELDLHPLGIVAWSSHRAPHRIPIMYLQLT